ncbi:MAG: phosphatase PAP2 family protein [Deltaproteobacteria bacterium]|nr:phosphatase PAP2 family protein [Deltaproteobacteria bacterium]
MIHMFHISDLLVFITRHMILAYGAVFLISLSESLALVGLIVPGTVIMFGIGAIVSTGSLKLLYVLLLAGAGAIAGDGISYWLGRHYKEELRRIWPFSRYSNLLKKGESFFMRHGGKSVLFGRFVGPVRPVIPVVAGMLGMSPLNFTVVNVLSAIGWALVYILPGVFFGASLAVAGAVSTRLAVLVFILLAVIWAFVWLGRRLVLLIQHQGPARFVVLQGEGLFLGFLALMAFMAGWGFLGVLQDMLAKDPLVLADQAVYHFFQSLRTPWAEYVFVGITELGDFFVNAWLSGAILLVLLCKRRWRTAVFWTLTMAGGIGGVQLLKYLIHLPRPGIVYIPGSGFPSSHTAMTVILYGFLAIILARGLSTTLSWCLFVSVFLISFAVATSHLYLGIHWFSDVMGGFFIGICWTALLGIAYLKTPEEGVPRRLLGVVTILVVVVAGGWHLSMRHKKDFAFYAPVHHMQSMSMATWKKGGWRSLPTWRIDMAGEIEHPLTIQWAGSIDGLSRYLSARGWHHPPLIGLKTFLEMFSPDTPVENLPVLPHLHNGLVDRLRLVRQDKDTRLVLRMWPSDVKITDTNTPLFVGEIERQRRQHLAALITVARSTKEDQSSLSSLENKLSNQLAVKPVYRTENKIQKDGDHHPLPWQGRVLLLWRKVK